MAGSDAGAVVGRGRPSSLRLQHVALNVGELQACERFYREILGLEVIWRPDEDSVYLTNGSDNLALHRSPQARTPVPQSLDHIGFALVDESAVDAWHDYLSFHGAGSQQQPGKGADLELKTPECDCWNSLDPSNRGCSCVASWARPT